MRRSAYLALVGALSFICMSPASALEERNLDQTVMDPGAGYRQLTQPFLTKRDEAPGGMFLMTHFEDKHWVVDFVSEKMPSRTAASQEIFYISKDKSRWYLAVPRSIGNCLKEAISAVEPYTACNSAFGSFSGAGAIASTLTSLGTTMLFAKPMSIDAEQLRRAIYSVPEESLEAKVSEYQNMLRGIAATVR